jgi:hypothetical protein
MFKVAKQINGSRKYFKEERITGLESSQNARTMVGQVLGCVNCYETIVQASPTTGSASYEATHNDLGDTLYHDATDIDTKSVSMNQKWGFSKHKIKYHFVNTSDHAVHLEIWEYVKNGSQAAESGTAIDTQFVKDIHESMLESGISGGTHTVNKREGDDVVTRSNNILTNYSQYLQPGGPYLRKHWKKLKYRKIKLNPADECVYTVRLKNIVFDISNYRRIGTTGTTGEEIDFIAGVTKGFLYSFSGPIGRSTAAGAEGVIGLLKSDIALAKVEHCSVVPMFNGERVKHFEVNTDDMTGVTLGASTQHAHLQEDAQ